MSKIANNNTIVNTNKDKQMSYLVEIHHSFKKNVISKNAHVHFNASTITEAKSACIRWAKDNSGCFFHITGTKVDLWFTSRRALTYGPRKMELVDSDPPMNDQNHMLVMGNELDALKKQILELRAALLYKDSVIEEKTKEVASLRNLSDQGRNKTNSSYDNRYNDNRYDRSNNSNYGGNYGYDDRVQRSAQGSPARYRSDGSEDTGFDPL